MHINEYSNLALRTAPESTVHDALVHGALGMVGEVGEVVDIIKKTFAYGKELNKGKLLEELYDGAWYINLNLRTCTTDQLDMEKLMQPAEAVLADTPFGTASIEDLVMISTSMADKASTVLSNIITMVANDMEIEEATELVHKAFTTSCELLQTIFVMTKMLGFTKEEGFERNIKKLETRYPNLRFDADHAINRNVEAEQAAVGTLQ